MGPSWLGVDCLCQRMVLPRSMRAFACFTKTELKFARSREAAKKERGKAAAKSVGADVDRRGVASGAKRAPRFGGRLASPTEISFRAAAFSVRFHFLSAT